MEGTKSVLEVLNSDYKVLELYGTAEFIEKNSSEISVAGKIEEATQKELASAGSFRTNDGALAVVKTKRNSPWNLTGYGIMLDGINDPGNLGTIIRIADWYGISGIVASTDVPDLYNPKVIAASKGSFSRIPVYYTDLPEFISHQKTSVWGADLVGENIHTFTFPESGWIVMGSEAHGISSEVESLLTGKLTIPSFGRSESLNAGMATAIICDNMRRTLG